MQQPEDSEDSEDSQDSQDVEPEQENMNMDKKLPNLMKLSSSFVVGLLVKSWESLSVPRCAYIGLSQLATQTVADD